MSRIVGVILVLVLLMLALGIIIPAVYQSRDKEEMARCQDNLRRIGSFGVFHSALPNKPPPLNADSYFPAGTIVNLQLAPEDRLSWYVTIVAAVEKGPPEDEKSHKKKSFPVAELLKSVDDQQPWNADAQHSLAYTSLNFLVCPGRLPQTPADQPAPTNYVGNGGLGVETAAIPVELAGEKAGVFRYDSPTPLELIRNGDGLSNTISILETSQNLGPWIRGGPSTVRSLDGQPPFLGVDAPFGGNHRGRGNYSFADGSARVLTDQTDPAVFRALLTIQGRETEFGEP
jgi:prepilin-type processing-associated H-X9-DG protein